MTLEQTSRHQFLSAAAKIAVGAALITSLSQSYTAEAQPPQQPRPATATQTSYAAKSPFLAQAPTADRPYYYVRYDEKTKAANPERSPLQVGLHIIGEPFHGDKIIVVNYIAENSRFSTMQTQLLQTALKNLAAESKKPFLLVDVVAYDKNGKGIYHADTEVALQRNTLGKNNETIKLDPNKDLIPPYGQIIGTSFEKGKEDHVVHLMDFALMNIAGHRVSSDELLRANADDIYDAIQVAVNGYNKRLAARTPVAAITSEAPAVAALAKD